MSTQNVERKSFKYNFLKQIIIRLDFQGVLHAEMENILLEVKPYLKEKKFNRYEQKVSNEINININNGIFNIDESSNESRNIVIHSFVNENRGYSVDMSINFLCLRVDSTVYIPFEEYSQIFMDIANIYKTKIDFFTVKRFGLRKINFCFISDINKISKYFSKRYFDYYDFFKNSVITASEKKENFVVDNCKINLLCDIEKGQLADEQTYKVTLDSDIYMDQSHNIEETIFDKNVMTDLNDKLFAIYTDTLTEEFVEMLSNEDTIWTNEIKGVEKNE